MLLGEILVAWRLIAPADIDAALVRARGEGGRLGDNLVALGRLSADKLAAVIRITPPSPTGLAETGIPPRNLLGLLLKLMLVEACDGVPAMADRMKLPPRLVQELLDDATSQRYVETRGAVAGSIAFGNRYALTERGRAAARDAVEQCQYVGPAPVPLTMYREQVIKQHIRNERLDEAAMREGFAGLVVPDYYFRRLLPAINAGRTVLLYGPPGNGKTTLATRISNLFRDVVYIPYAVEIDGEIIKVFDPALHQPALPEADAAALAAKVSLHRDGFDDRWAVCRRPVAVAGGEMTLEMLDLQYNTTAKLYEAPLHMKALNGMLLIDDFGRQKFNPNELLNRWIVPMESQVDFFKLHSGATFSLPFDELLMFSTNLQPADLVDPAFLRRIPYKIRLLSPTRDEFRQIFDAVSRARSLELPDDVFDYIVDTLERSGFELAYYQPNFICNQVMEACACFGLPLVLTRQLATEALMNLYFDIKQAPDRGPGAPRIAASFAN